MTEGPVVLLVAHPGFGEGMLAAATSILGAPPPVDHISNEGLSTEALGAAIEVRGDDIIITGPRRLEGASTDSLDDHRLAMTFAIAGLIARGATAVGRPASAAISYPGFFSELERVGA